MNNPLPLPQSPHDAVNESTCCCGATYATSRYDVSFSQGVALVRANNVENGNGYRSRGPVLWAMHVLKLTAWYQDHSACQYYEPY